MTEVTEVNLLFVSWNTRGVRDTSDFSSKSEDIMKELKRLGASIAFLQETHIGPNGNDILRNVKGWHSFFTVHNARSKGVAILIRKSLNYTFTFLDEDYGGSYIVLVCQLQGKDFTLVNVYNHAKDKSVLRRLTQYLQDNTRGILVIGGDFNTILHYDFDRKYPTGHHQPLRQYLEEFIYSLNLVDVWGQTHPIKREFTYLNGKFTQSKNRAILKTLPKKATKQRKMPSKRCSLKKQKHNTSRLDMFFIPWNKMDYVKNCIISKSRISDHDPVILDLNVQPSMGPAELIETPVNCRLITLREVQQRYEFKKPGEISGAEVQMAIKSLMVCESIFHFDQEKDNENTRVAITDYLKFKFNNMLSGRKMNQQINRHSKEYLILTTILARRLEVYLRPSFKSRTHQTKFELLVMVTFRTVPETTTWSFIETALKALKKIHPAPPRNFSILKTLLTSPGNSELLLEKSPLTSAILTLSLTWLAQNLKRELRECEVDVCRHRQCMVVYMHPDMYKTLKRKLSIFQRRSNMDVAAYLGRAWYRRQRPVLNLEPDGGMENGTDLTKC